MPSPDVKIQLKDRNFPAVQSYSDPSTCTAVDVRDVRESVVLLLLSKRCTGAGAANMTVPCPAPPHTPPAAALCCFVLTNAANTPAHTPLTLGTVDSAYLRCASASRAVDFIHLENDTHLNNSVGHGAMCWTRRVTRSCTDKRTHTTLDNNGYTSRLCSPSVG
jgi:hypothetical protein